MNQLKLLVDIMGASFDTIILYYYMRTVFRHCRISRGIEISAYFIMMIFISFTSIYYTNTIIISIMFFIGLMILSIIYEERIVTKIVLNFIISGIFILSELITVMVITSLVGEALKFVQANVIYYLQGVLVSKLLVFVVVKIIDYRINNNFSLVHKKILIPLVLIPIPSILIIYIISVKAFIITNTYVSLLTVLIIVIIIIVNIIILYMFEKQLNREEEKIKAEFFKQQLENQKKHFIELAENQRRINRTLHDFRNELLAILGLF